MESSSHIRALLVEDNPDDVAMFQFRIAESGIDMELQHVVCLSDALSLDPEDVDLIWLDLNLPDSHGAATVARVREGFPKTPLIVLSGTEDERIARNSLRNGAQDYVNKHQFDGRVLKRVAGFAVERVQIESRLEQIVDEQNRVGSARHWVEEANFRDLYENAPVMFASVDHETGAILRCNERLADALGYKRKDLVGRSVFDLYHPSCLEDVQLAFSGFLGKGSVEFAELQLLHKDGHPIDVALSASSVTDDEGKVILSRACWIDIGSRIRAEKALSESNRLLEQRVDERTQQFENLVAVSATTSDLIAMCDLDGRVHFMNEAGMMHLGLNKDEIDSDLKVTDLFNDSQKQRSSDEVIPALRKTGRWSGRFDLPNRRTDHVQPLQWEVFVLRDRRTGRATGLGTVARDLTDELQKQAELQLQSERLSFTVGISGIGSWVWDAEKGPSLEIDENLRETLGIDYSTLEKGAKDILAFVHPDDRETVRTEFTAALKTGSASTSEYRIQRPDGKIRYVQARGGAHMGENGKPLWGVGTIWDVTERKAMEEELRQLTIRDPLTDIFNRRYLDATVEQEWRRGLRNGMNLSLLMVDIDHFKRYNDSLGHRAGDQCLQQVAKLLSEHVRRSADFVARYGGEEFAVVLPDTELERAKTMADQLCNAVIEAKIPHPMASNLDIVSISVGVSSLPCVLGNSTATLFKKADQALYQAKLDGRNCYRVG